LHSKYPERVDILMLLGQVTAWQKKYQPSVEFYKKALAIHPDNTTATKGLATTYKWMKNTEEGVKLYAKILEEEPNNIDALMGTGILLSQGGKNKEAIVYLEKARDAAPNRADVRAMLGTLYSWTAQLDDAVTELQKSVALEQGNISNRNINNYIALGRIFRWQKKKEESIKLFQKALELEPNNTEAMIGLGRVYVFDDQWDKAEELYMKALTLEPNNLDAKEALAQLKRFKAPEANFRYNFFEARLHNPNTGQISSTFIDHRETIESFFKLSPKTTIQARYQHAERRQLGPSNTSTAFNVDTETVSFGLNQKLPYNFDVRLRYDVAQFSNDNPSNSTANLRETENDYSGFFILTKRHDRHLWRLSLGRELFIDTNPGFSTIEDINTYSIS
ncbi:MAG: tetratricopeptide repeat protein, partial [Proteobacteria bacterium]|nr:tetratricopeptide repeat protein [Pseudomonadota bacterium]